MFRRRFLDNWVGEAHHLLGDLAQPRLNHELFRAKPQHLVGPTKPTTTYRHFLSPPNTPKSNAETVSCVYSPPEITKHLVDRILLGKISEKKSIRKQLAMNSLSAQSLALSAHIPSPD